MRVLLLILNITLLPKYDNFGLNNALTIFLQIRKDWEVAKQFVLAEVQPVLLSDSSGYSKPLSYDTNDPVEIQTIFGDISYNKGGSVIKMLQSFLGIENFKQGLTRYLNNQ